MKAIQLAKVPLAKRSRPDILIIAGEASGDEHAAQMVKDLLQKHSQLSIYAFGGRNLRSVGAHLLYDLTQHSVVGIYEVLKHLRLFRQLMSAVIAWINTHQPRTVCFVDYPGFNLRIAKELFKRGLSCKNGGDVALYYYISPQVWAWKARRRFSMAEWLDHLAVIFPFEKKVFKDTSLKVSFVGHPLLQTELNLGIFYDPKGPLLLLPGSRVASVRRIFPLMLETFRQLRQSSPQLSAVVLYSDDRVLNELRVVFLKYKDLWQYLRFYHIEDSNLSYSASLMSSGTMSLKCALAAIPSVIAYKIHPLTYMLAKRFVKIPFIGMANILLKRMSIPEYIQEAAHPDILCGEISECLQDPRRIMKVREDADALKIVLDVKPDMSAADWLYSSLKEEKDAS
ncbi:MAG: lipid-A-disaccharide synthase [Puniceicoccales bacterium]|jgi:lipid-A-disaccharide synthase|nr:lipid-A-disaccharide synthase [Puniceicoccales bacterium]